MKGFWLCFVPLFVAVDAIGVLPLFLNLTQGVERSRRRRIVSKIASLLMAAIAVMMVRKGIVLLLAGGG